MAWWSILSPSLAQRLISKAYQAWLNRQEVKSSRWIPMKSQVTSRICSIISQLQRRLKLRSRSTRVYSSGMRLIRTCRKIRPYWQDASVTWLQIQCSLLSTAWRTSRICSRWRTSIWLLWLTCPSRLKSPILHWMALNTSASSLKNSRYPMSVKSWLSKLMLTWSNRTSLFRAQSKRVPVTLEKLKPSWRPSKDEPRMCRASHGSATMPTFRLRPLKLIAQWTCKLSKVEVVAACLCKGKDCCPLVQNQCACQKGKLLRLNKTIGSLLRCTKCLPWVSAPSTER